MNKQDKENALLEETLAKFGVSLQLYEKTLYEEKKRVHMQRRRNITDELRHIIEQQASKDDVK